MLWPKAYVHKGSPIVCGLRGERKRTLTNDAGGRALQVLLCSGKYFDFLVVALNTGVQVWSTDGARMIYLFDTINGSSARSGPSVKNDGVQFTQGIAFVPGGTTFIVGCSDGDVFAFDTKCGSKGEVCELKATLRGHDHAVTCAGADSDCYVTGDASGTIVVWSAARDLGRRCSFDGDGNPATAVCARRGLAVASFSTGHLRIFDTCKRTLAIEIAAHSRTINAIDLHPSSTLVATVGEDMYLNVWEFPESGRDGPSGQVGLLASSCALNRLLTGVRFSVDGSQRIFATAYDCVILHTWHKL
ncbi:unnamed protein product [Ascophyllum nodosum]